MAFFFFLNFDSLFGGEETIYNPFVLICLWCKGLGKEKEWLETSDNFCNFKLWAILWVFQSRTCIYYSWEVISKMSLTNFDNFSLLCSIVFYYTCLFPLSSSYSSFTLLLFLFIYFLKGLFLLTFTTIKMKQQTMFQQQLMSSWKFI